MTSVADARHDQFLHLSTFTLAVRERGELAFARQDLHMNLPEL